NLAALTAKFSSASCRVDDFFFRWAFPDGEFALNESERLATEFCRDGTSSVCVEAKRWVNCSCLFCCCCCCCCGGAKVCRKMSGTKDPIFLGILLPPLAANSAALWLVFQDRPSLSYSLYCLGVHTAPCPVDRCNALVPIL